MKKIILGLSFVIIAIAANAQKIIGECTVDFTVTYTDKANVASGITSTLYIKAKQARLELNSQAFTQSKIFNGKTGDVIILQDAGNSHFMRKLSSAKWLGANKKFEGATLNSSTDKKTILGYECEKATLTLKDGSSYKLYYTKAITPSFNEYEYQFKDVPGFVLEYESTDEKGANKITYSATKINLNPVPAAKFDVPTTGYRVIE